MKKLKTLCAVVGAAAMLYGGSALGAEQKYKVPEYDRKDAVGTMTLTLDEWGRYEDYLLDRNKDGITDLIEVNLTFYDQGKPTVKARFLKIDDNFDGYADRVLTDKSKEDGTLGMDGIYDVEDIIPENVPME